MKFSDYKRLFIKSTRKRKLLVGSIKNIHNNYRDLEKFTKKFGVELKSANTLLKQSILGKNPFPKSYDNLNRGEIPLLTGSIQKEMNWQVLAFLKNSKIINKFISLRSEFEHNFIIANYVKARQILEKVEREICISYWSIENRFFLDEYQFGSEQNWETRNKVMANENHVLVRVFGDIFSIKAEKGVSFFQFIETYDKWEKESGLEKRDFSLAEYCRFKSNYFSLSEYNQFASILSRESNSSIIDRYILFIRIAQHLLADDSENNKFVFSLLRLLKEEINDVHINNMLWLSDNNTINVNDKDIEVITILDKYTEGNYLDSKKLSKSFLSNDGSNFIELFKIYTKSLIELGLPYEPLTNEESFGNQISKIFYDIFSKNESTDEAILKLLKLAYTFNNSHIGLYFFLFVREELGWTDSSINYNFLSILNSNFNNPLLTYVLYDNKELASHYLDNLNSTFRNSTTIKLYKNFYNNYFFNEGVKEFENVQEVKNELYSIRSLILKDLFEESLYKCKDLLSKENLSVITKFETISSLFLCYSKLEMYRECLILYTDTFLLNPNLTKKMDVNSLKTCILKSKFKNLGDKKDLIDLPIFLKENYNEKIKIKQAYELFLRANSCNIPSDLIIKKDRFEEKKLIYFLKNVCILEILQLSKSFDSTNKVNEERINICKFLAKIDSTEENIYKEEIAMLTQKNTISKVIGGIDERKIFVNEKKIRENIKGFDKQNVLYQEQVSPLTSESFDRYTRLFNYMKKKREYRTVNTILQFEDDGEMTLVEVKREFMKNQDIDFVLYLPVFRIFVSYFLYIRDLFISNKQHGLEDYLSTRVRHGTLPNHLRSVFETYSLVTAQTDNVYAENNYWLDKLELSQNKMNKLQEILANFSENIDSVSKEIKDDYVQLRDEKRDINPHGLFDFSYNEEELIKLFLNEFYEISDINEFINKSFSELWNRTENCLVEIRNKFNNEFRNNYIILIDTLLNDINKLGNKRQVSELLTNLKICRTEIQTKLNNISKWFRRSESSFDSEYELQILVETSIQITKNIHPYYSFEIEKDICENFKIKGEYHQNFIDLINNFLFNMIKHSNLTCENLNAKITIKESGKILTLSFENNVADIYIKEHSDKLLKIKDNWELPDINISKEGGTGYPKIKKIIKSDLNRKSSIFNFSFQEKKLNISLPFEFDKLKA